MTSISSLPPEKDSLTVFTRPNYNLLPPNPTIMIIDAEEERAQRLARILCLSGYRALVEFSLYQALERAFREQITPQALLLGQADLPHHHLFARFVGRLGRQKGQATYLIPSLFRGTIPDEPPLAAKLASPSSHTFSPECLSILTAMNAIVPSTIRYQYLKVDTQALALSALPSAGLFPRLAHHRLIRNSYFLIALKAAYSLIGSEQWDDLLGDVGLACYRATHDWPADTDAYTIPIDYLSYLQQALLFSRPTDQANYLQQWGYTITDHVIQKRGLPLLAQQAIKLLGQERQMQATLNAFTRQMNEIRNEELYEWVTRYDGTYWLVHHSNLYAYGRINALQEPACHVWLGSLERVFRQAGLDITWQVREKECSCQTLTGHCIFEITPR